MTVKVRPYKNGGWEVDIVIPLETGQVLRRRLKSPVKSKSGSLAWGREHALRLIHTELEPTSAEPAAADPQPTHRPARDEYDRLDAAAAKIDPGVHLQVLLGGDAGLRPGEVRALHWTSVDFPAGA